jgi:hypothetical protein
VVARLIQLFGRVDAQELLQGGTHPMMTLYRAPAAVPTV